MIEASAPLMPASSATVWHVRREASSRYRVRYCCRGKPCGEFDLLLTPWLPAETDLPSITEEALALCAAGLVLDTFATAIPVEVDLENMTQVDPAFMPRLRDRLRGTIR
ncbi:hypothetical protein AB0F91_36930 [Amycolatopsis sp. NPDC023774]|uniref:hypothetical protein n=1 Tax=Amycolatopsis sp. NPDC023774 TaxID=3155015 RepID=UPI00340164C6